MWHFCQAAGVEQGSVEQSVCAGTERSFCRALPVPRSGRPAHPASRRSRYQDRSHTPEGADTSWQPDSGVRQLLPAIVKVEGFACENVKAPALSIREHLLLSTLLPCPG